MEPFGIPLLGSGRAIAFAVGDGYLNPFAVEPRELIEWFENKAPREIGNWRELGPEEYARAFTAARTAGYDIVNDLHREFVRVMAEEGATGLDFRSRVMPILRQKGWLADLSERQKAARVDLIFDTNLRVAQASGRWQRIQRSKVALPYLVAGTARDDRVRERHVPFEGIVLPVDHSFWLSYFPPLGFRCRCFVVQRSRAQIARAGLEVTTEAELAARIAAMGPSWGFNPAVRPLRSVEEAAEATNAERLEGAPPINVQYELGRAQSLWSGLAIQAAAEAVEAVIRRLFD